MTSSPDRNHQEKKRRPRLRYVLLVYLLLLLASHFVRRVRGAASPPEGEEMVLVQVVDGEDLSVDTTELWYREVGLPDATGHPVLLLHGSPGSKGAFKAVAPHLGARRAIAVDLPGFGSSRGGDLPDYSVRAHARYVEQLLDELGLETVHVVGYSMGGGVGLELADRAPARVASLTLLSAIGVQELELFGNHTVNHLVHGGQLAALWTLHEAVPHFGALDESMFSVEYARNFRDTDQRPLRGILERWAGPTLVLHGDVDPLVPPAAAREHHRLVPQSRLEMLEGGHMLVFTDGELIGGHIAAFLDDVEAGVVPSRAEAASARVAAAGLPFDGRAVPAIGGIALVLFMLVAAAATIISEDLTCVAVGALVGQGRVDFVAGAFACFLGIYVGDILLYFAGRTVGRRAMHRAPLKWVLDEARVARGSEWFARRGPVVILLSRFMPGARLPTYFAGGLLRTSFPRFALWFALAAGVWTPILVWLSGQVGGELTERVTVLRENLLLALVITVVAGLLLFKVGVPALHHRGRRMLVRRWRRLARWEYWPPWAFYLPLAPHFAWLAVRHRGLTVFSAANPAVPGGGFVGESKSAILAALMGGDGRLPAWTVVPAGENGEAARGRVRALQGELDAPWPLVVKPDAGERGNGVHVVRNDEELGRALTATRMDAIVQEHVDGAEYGIFYARRPAEARGFLLSITDKRLPRVRGDGRRTLERLILDDPRGVCLAPYYLGRHAARLHEVPGAGADVVLGELGTHCKGALFLDGGHLATEELTRVIDEVARGYEGFYFGRFDVRAADEAALARGEFRILELNGVSSEATHIYDPRHSVLTAWRTIAAQWSLAYEIGAANARRGAKVTGTLELLRAWRDHRRAARPVASP